MFGKYSSRKQRDRLPCLDIIPADGGDARAVMKQFHVLVNFAFTLGHQLSSVRLGQLPYYLGVRCVFLEMNRDRTLFERKDYI
jgi:hypothetical protein